MAPGRANVNEWNRNRLLHARSINVGGASHWEGTVVQYIQRRRAAMWRANEGCPTLDDHKHWIPTPPIGKLTVAAQQGVRIVNQEAYDAQMSDHRRRQRG
jgi:hypothetical protein